MPEQIHIEGLIPLQRALKAIDGEAQKELRLVLNEAAEIVVKGAKRRAPVKSGRLAKTIKAQSQQRAAVVSGNTPYFGFIDYGNVTHGGRRAVGPGDSQVRPFIKTGRILYPAFLAQEKNIQKLLQIRLDALIEKHGLDVT